MHRLEYSKNIIKKATFEEVSLNLGENFKHPGIESGKQKLRHKR